MTNRSAIFRCFFPESVNPVMAMKWWYSIVECCLDIIAASDCAFENESFFESLKYLYRSFDWNKTNRFISDPCIGTIEAFGQTDIRNERSAASSLQFAPLVQNYAPDPSIDVGDLQQISVGQISKTVKKNLDRKTLQHEIPIDLWRWNAQFS